MPDSSDGITVDVDVTTPDPAMHTGRLWIAFHERAVRGSNVAYYADLATALDRTARWYWRGVYGHITKPVAWRSFAGGGLWQLHDADGHTGVVVTTDELHGAAKPSASLIDSSRPETDSEAAQRRGRFFLDIWREKDRTPCIGFVMSETRVALNGDYMARLMVGDLEVLLDDSDALQRMRAAADSVPALLSHGTYEGPPISQELADALNGPRTVMLLPTTATVPAEADEDDDDIWTDAELIARLQEPHPEQWSDVFRVLAERVANETADWNAGRGRFLLADGTRKGLDAAAIIRNFGWTLTAAAEAGQAAVGDDIEAAADPDHAAEWREIRDRLHQAARDLHGIADGWI